MNNKRLLQIFTSILGLVPILTGIVGLFGLSDPIYANANLPSDAMLDSNLRFLSGVWLGLGLTVIWLIPRIETQTVLFRVLWGMIFLGGVGRLLSMLVLGWPPIPFIAFTVLEIVGAPIFIAWQARLAK
jgi:hypothetical protein